MGGCVVAKVPRGWAGPVADVLCEVDAIAPGFSDYVLDERGALRRHVKIAINNTVVIDRIALSDHVPESSVIY